MVKKILFLLFCFGSSLQAVVVVVNVMPGDVLNWSNYASLGPTDVLEVVLSNPSGEVQLLAAGDMNMVTTVTCNGTIRFTSSAGTIFDEGQIFAPNVILEAKRILIDETALIDASVNSGGGTIFVGGGLHGMDPNIHNANTVIIGSSAILRTDALMNGNGGTIVVWSEIGTGFIGSISATGMNGNGGEVEISSNRYLVFDGSVDVSAFNGSSGVFLLDPVSITVQAANPDIDGNGTHLDITFITQLDDATTTPAGFPNASSIITAGALAGLLTNNVNLTLAAQNFITFNAALSPAGTNVTLTLSAPTINLNSPITLASGGTLVGSGVTTVNIGPSGNPQNGIDLATNGTTVNLSATTYTVSPNAFNIINKNLIFNGQGIGSTTILLTGAVPSHSSRNPLIFVQNGTDTVIQNMTVDGAFIGFPTNGNITGILYSNAGGTISNVHATRIANSAPPYGGGQQGAGIRCDSLVSLLSLNITDCVIDLFQKVGIAVNGLYTLNASGNQVTGLGVPSTPSAIGIQVSSGTTGTVTGNTVSGIQFADHASADGILAFLSGNNLMITNNTFSNNDEGILAFDSGGGLVISGNVVSGSGDTGIIAIDTSGDTTITGNTLTDNGGLAGPAAGNTGIYLFSSTTQTFEVNQNTITPSAGQKAIFIQGNAVNQAPDASLFENIFIDP